MKCQRWKITSFFLLLVAVALQGLLYPDTTSRSSLTLVTAKSNASNFPFYLQMSARRERFHIFSLFLLNAVKANPTDQSQPGELLHKPWPTERWPIANLAVFPVLSPLMPPIKNTPQGKGGRVEGE